MRNLRVPLCFKCGYKIQEKIENRDGVKGFRLVGCKAMSQESFDKMDSVPVIERRDYCPIMGLQ